MPESLLRLLQQENGFVSGEKLSRLLGISRAAVWKKIRSLRQRGCVIDSVRSRGYRLQKTPDLFSDTLREALAASFWKEVRVFDVVDSTNEIALDAASELERGKGIVFVADSQRKGKGRLGRAWTSPAGRNIYLSFLFRPELSPRDAPMLTFLASVACAEAVRSLCRVPVAIKWPNDLLVSGRKLGGILTEVRSDPDRILFAVVGIGINVNMRRPDFPDGIRRAATSVRIETGRDFPRNDLILAIARGFERWLRNLPEGGREKLLDAWRKLSSTIGRDVKVQTGSETLTGHVQDIDENGLLVLRTAGGSIRKISAGDVTMLRSEEKP